MSKWNARCDYSGMLRVIYEDDHSHGDEDHGDEDEDGGGSISASEGIEISPNGDDAASKSQVKTPNKHHEKASHLPKTEESIDEDEIGLEMQEEMLNMIQ